MNPLTSHGTAQPTAWLDSAQRLEKAREAARNLEWMFFDVDGVMTDGGLFYGPDGEVLKRFNVMDGHGLKALRAGGVKLGILSGRSHPATEFRAKELGFSCVVLGNSKKGEVFDGLVQSLGLNPQRCGHMGDDAPDLEVFHRVGFTASVPHAIESVRDAALWVARHAGGHGAVRECCDFILDCRT